jgi:hypothetical protein
MSAAWVITHLAAWRAVATLAVLTLALVVTPAAHAGRSCEARAPDAQRVQQGLDLAQRTHLALEATKAQVVVLARAGQDLSRYGLRYSHLGLAYRSAEGWRVVHKLNQCGTATAELWRQGLAEFFLDDPHEFRAGVVVLSAAAQAALLPLLKDNQHSAMLHNPAYNMLAYPWAQTYQQSNQWAIETLALALEPQASSRERAQAWLQFKGYQPTTLRLGAMTRLGARISTANVAFDDHPSDKRYSDRIETVTVDSVFDWLQRSGLGQPVQVVW